MDGLEKWYSRALEPDLMRNPRPRTEQRSARRRARDAATSGARPTAARTAAAATPAVAGDGGRGVRALARRPDLVAAALLAVVTVVAYVPAIRGGFVWDDDAYVTANSTLRDLDGLRRIWLEPGAVPQYYPLTFTSFWVEHHVFGASPLAITRSTSCCTSAAALLLGVALLRRLAVPGAWLAAALFALHPVAGRVGGVDQRAQERALGRALSRRAALAYLGWSGDAPAPGRARSRRAYLAALALFVARAAGEDGHVHVARRAARRAVVEARAPRARRDRPAGAVLRDRSSGSRR